MEKNIFLEGFYLTFKNAERLYNSAEILENAKEIAIANSLLVLCAEELMKSYTILTQHFYPEKIIDNYQKSFEDHKHKLDSIRSIKFIAQLYKQFNDLYYKPMFDNFMEEKEDFKELKAKSFKNLLDWLNNESKSNKTELAKENTWWTHAKTMKENGFYVGYSQGKWTTPNSLKKSNYSKTKQYVTEFYNQIKLLTNIDFSNEENLNLIMTLKDKLTI